MAAGPHPWQNCKILLPPTKWTRIEDVVCHFHAAELQFRTKSRLKLLENASSHILDLVLLRAIYTFLIFLPINDPVVENWGASRARGPASD